MKKPKKSKAIMALIALVVGAGALFSTVGIDSEPLAEIFDAEGIEVYEEPMQCRIFDIGNFRNCTIDDAGEINKVKKLFKGIKVRFMLFSWDGVFAKDASTILYAYFTNKEGRSVEMTFTADGRVYYDKKAYKLQGVDRDELTSKLTDVIARYGEVRRGF